MLAVGNPYAKTSGSGKENLCAIYLSVDLSIYPDLVGENMEINIGEGGIEKRDIFLKRNLFRWGMIVMINRE